MKGSGESIEDLFARLGVRKLEDLYFKANPDKIGSVSEVKMEFVKCPGCQQNSLRAWIYKQNGDWLQESVMTLCAECQKEAYAKKLGKSLTNKRQDIIDTDWYFIKEKDQSGFKNYETINQKTKAPSPELVAAKTKATDYVKSLLKGEIRNLRISGTPGTGKTHLSKAIARTLKDQEKNVAFINADKLFDKLKATFGNDYEKDKLFERFKSFDYVVIDDIGVETNSQKEISWASNTWVKFIDLREDKVTIYTTNFDEKTLVSVIGARAESRMSDNADKIEIYTPGQDYRKLDSDDRLFY